MDVVSFETMLTGTRCTTYVDRLAYSKTMARDWAQPIVFHRLRTPVSAFLPARYCVCSDVFPES
jgi:hypothetical protein